VDKQSKNIAFTPARQAANSPSVSTSFRDRSFTSS